MTSKLQNHSTTSLQSSRTVSSNTPVTRPQKDYAAALGALQSRYGTGGSVPNPKKEASKKLPSTSATPLEPSTPELSSQTTLISYSTVSESSDSQSRASRDENKRHRKSNILRSLFKGKEKGNND